MAAPSTPSSAIVFGPSPPRPSSTNSTEPRQSSSTTRITGPSVWWFSLTPGRERQHERPQEREQPEHVDADRAPRCGGGFVRGRRRGVRRARVGAGVGGRSTASLCVDHASASATCSGVSHPGPNARVICGANTVESPRTTPGVAVGDDLAAREHHDAGGDRRGEFHVVGRDDRHAAVGRVPRRNRINRSFASGSRPRVGSSSAITGAMAGRDRRGRDQQPLARAQVARDADRRGRRCRARRAPVRVRGPRPRAFKVARTSSATVSANRIDSGSWGHRPTSMPGSGCVAVHRHASPSAGSCTPAIARSSVVLPAPLRPITATISPRRDREVDAAQRDLPAVTCLHAAHLDQRGAGRRRPGQSGTGSAAATASSRPSAGRLEP